MARIAPYSEDSPPAPAPGIKKARISMAPPKLEDSAEARPSSCCSSLRNCRESCIESQTGQSIRKFLRGRPFSIVTMISLFLALFLGEIFVVCQVPSNTELDVVLTIVFVIFLFEWIGLTFTDASYLFGFFFFMDLVGTASMVLDITYMLGQDAMQIDQVTEGTGQENVIVVRAARAAKLGARAGRLSRAVKLLKMLPGMSTKEDQSKVKIARVISNQLNTVLSTRVAFLTICVVVVLPLFQMLQYPEMDDSMGTWAELLDRNAAQYKTAANSTVMLEQQALLQTEVDRMMEAYSTFSYGPFHVCYGTLSGGVFMCQNDVLTLNFTSKFARYGSRSGIHGGSVVRVYLVKAPQCHISLCIVCAIIYWKFRMLIPINMNSNYAHFEGENCVSGAATTR